MNIFEKNGLEERVALVKDVARDFLHTKAIFSGLREKLQYLIVEIQNGKDNTINHKKERHAVASALYLLS